MIIFPGLLGSISKAFSSAVVSFGWREQILLSGTFSNETSDNFGIRVGINSTGDKLIVTADLDESPSAASGSGLAYIFYKDGDIWLQEQILSGTLAIDSNDRFGTSVAMNASGDRVVVGASLDERTGTTGEGLAYVFSSGSTGWYQEHILSGTLAVVSGDAFGNSAAINSAGNIVVIGALGDEPSGTTNQGLVYIFSSGSTGWTQQHILSGSLATVSGDRFGVSVDVNNIGDRIVVGADADERTGTNGEGLAYVFVSGGLGWTEEAILSGTLATANQDRFGRSVAINSNGDRIVVGSPEDERAGTTGEGLAYLFVSGATGWREEHIISGSLAIAAGDQFGINVDINAAGDRVVVGASGDETTGTTNHGLAYLFVSGATGWSEQQIFSGSLSIDSSDAFGISVAINSVGDCVLVGANQDELSGSSNYGIAYVFVSGS